VEAVAVGGVGGTTGALTEAEAAGLLIYINNINYKKEFTLNTYS
jgi:hypothetical protein